MKCSLYLATALFVTGLPHAVLRAQDTEYDADEDVYEMSPFTVTTDNDDRYYASNAISGTQLNVPIKSVPFNLEVITSEFMRDTGANDFKESLAFSSGIYTETYIDNSGAGPGNANRSPSEQAAVGSRQNNAVVIRGLTVPFQQRMGFRVGTFIGLRGRSSGTGSAGSGGLTLGSLIDTVNVDRSEVVRGPGSLLYGLGVLSGIVNIMPKRPMDDPRYELSLTVGNYDYYRATFDATGPLLHGEDGRNVLNYRVLGAWQDNEEWYDYYHEKKDYEALQLEWMPVKGLKVFGEVGRGRQHMQAHQGANGSGFFIRNTQSGWQSPPPQSKEFVNEYGENYRWGVEDFVGPYPDAWNPDWWQQWHAQQTSRELSPYSKWLPGSSLPTEAVDQMSPALSGPYNRPGFQPQGPDPWYERIEKSALLSAEWTVNENLSFQFGGFYTKQEEEEFLVNLGVINTADGLFASSLERLINPPEGEGKIPYESLYVTWNPLAENTDGIPVHHAISEYWRFIPQDGESRQTRMSGVYTFETPFIGGGAEHSILAGRQDIRDHANIWTGGPSVATEVWLPKGVQNGVEFGQDYEDSPLRVRSFYDWRNPPRYEGQPLVVPQGAEEDYTTTLWYTGHYAIYTGKFFNNRLTLIGGWRHDRYQAKETRWYHEPNDLTRYAPGDLLPTSGDPRYASGETYYNFVDPETGEEDPVTVSTWSFGLTYEITDTLSFYAVSAQGVLPNTGLRDGAYSPIAPEQTHSLEGGFKFDFFDGKLSGTVSVFQITRENAVWNYSNAPNPSQWEDGLDPLKDGTPANPGGARAAGVPNNYGFNYHLYFKEKVEGPDGAYWRQKLGITQADRLDPTKFRVPDSKNDVHPVTADEVYDPAKVPNADAGIMHISRSSNLYSELNTLTPDFMPYVFISYEALDETSPKFDQELYDIARLAITEYRSGDHPDYVQPLGFSNSGADNRYINANASGRRGASVTFEEEVTGVDLQLVISPNRNLQFTVNYSHVNREASSDFNLVPAVAYGHPELGNLATEFDIWVMDFGEDAFADPKDPTTLKGGIRGKSLYYGSEDSVSVWGRYSFRDGPLNGFGIGLGAIYNGPAQTYVPIGNLGSSENRYPTPDTEGNLQLRGALYYTKEFQNFTLRLQLNVNNLTNKTKLYSEASYDNPFSGEMERRRTERYLMPRTWRLSCTIIF